MQDLDVDGDLMVSSCIHASVTPAILATPMPEADTDPWRD